MVRRAWCVQNCGMRIDRHTISRARRTRREHGVRVSAQWLASWSLAARSVHDHPEVALAPVY